MTEASEWQRSTDSGGSRSSIRSSSGAGGVSESGASAPDISRPGDSAAGPSEAVLGPFTLRELIFGGGVLFAFLGTLLPYVDGLTQYNNFWNSASLFFVGLGILLPLAALALLVGRRLGTAGLRVGSLSVDQFASVTSVLAATFFFLETVISFHVGPFLCLLGALAMVTASVLAPFLPVLKNDFAERPEVPAHRVARPTTVARPRPRPEKPAAKAGSPVASSPTGSSPTGSSPTGSSPTASSPGASSSVGKQGKKGINPAAAGVRQNGAGLYGAGGAGAVGAGAAASGQSGLRQEPARAESDSTGHRPDSGSTDGGRADDRTGQAVGGASGAQDASPAPDQVETDGSAEPRHGTARMDETRVNDVVSSESTRSEFARPEASGAAGGADRSRQQPITATRSADEEPVVEAFWFAVGSSRPVYDEQAGQEVFTLEPGDWEVGIEDRGNEFLVQDKRTGVVGILRDLSNIERAPRD